jgi:hypothetical protein
VDDCNISHVDAKVNDQLIKELHDEYESIFEDDSGHMKVSRGKVHKYLGMTIDFTMKGQCKISMLEYIDDLLKAFEKVAPKETGTKVSAAPKDLFVVDEDSKKLSPERAEEFHSLVAKVLFATKCAWLDTGTAISYFTTWVREPNEQDWKKLVHLMKYLRGTKDLPLILSADGSGIHPNMCSHTGGGLTMGRGYPISSFTKQKLNTHSSTESKLVGVDDLMPAVLWTRQFLEAQGYGVRENIILQDNKSAILLEKNGKASSSKLMKHISIQYFFVTDMIKTGKVSIKWCPTLDMVADLWTKLNQGALFLKYRNEIMGMEKPSKKQTRAKGCSSQRS